MSADEEQIPEEDISTVITLQQSHYQHVQSMAATFLSILLTLVIAVGGLVSAGLISIQPPEVPSGVEPFNMLVLWTFNFSIPQGSVKMLVSTGIGYSVLYVVTGFLIILVACSKLLSCLNIEVLKPNESIRGINELSTTYDSDPTERIKTGWVLDNSKLNSRIDRKFRSAQLHLALGTFFILYATLRILFASDLVVGYLLILVCSLPLFVLSVLLYYPCICLKDIYHFYCSTTVPEKHRDTVLQSQILSAVLGVALAWNRDFKITERLNHHPIVYLFYITGMLIFLIPFSADFIVFIDVILSNIF
ncbi:hypothetical protein [Halorubrum trapanicum]|uniref:hypothetical protein n=1 Tax=Halorubrum trapanicum TaxID=29284 RepID=UPI0012FD2320|nr:hypothetical protein [Halorubrum trapanicum]